MGGKSESSSSMAGDPKDPMPSIGAMARRSRLSMKALRLYEEKGLLKPAHVDLSSGYRRYRQSQLATARLVVLLRRLDMPLAQVADVVAASPEEGAAIVAAHWAGVERRTAFQRELATHLQSRLSGTERQYDMFEIREREAAQQTVLTDCLRCGGAVGRCKRAKHRWQPTRDLFRRLGGGRTHRRGVRHRLSGAVSAYR